MVIVGNAARHLVINSLDGSPADKESGTNRGRLRGLVLPVGGVGDVGVPASVVVGEGVVEDPGADLEVVGARRGGSIASAAS